MRKINVIVPVYYDYEAFDKLIDNIKSYLFMFNHNIHFIVVDDTPDTGFTDAPEYLIKYKIESNNLENIIQYMRGAGSYGKSIKKAMLRSGAWYKLILMDVDHPFYLIPDIISLLDVNDVVIGNDLNGNDERKVTKWLLKKTLGIKIPHPTCGLMGFNKDVLGNECVTDKTIRFYFAKSNRDIIHVEFLYMCMKKNLSIGVVDFNTENTEIKHNYNIHRYITWLYDLGHVLLMDKLLNWYE